MAGAFSGRRARSDAGRPDTKGRAPDPSPASAASPVPERQERQETADDTKTRRLGLPVTADGRLDLDGLDGMRGSTKDAIRKALTADPAATARLLGQPIGGVAKSPEFVSAERAGRIYDMLSGVLVNTIGRRYGPEIAQQAFEFTEADKAVLGPSTAAVLNKYAGPFFSKYGDELELAGLLLSISWSKVALANTLLAAQEAQRTRPQAVPFARSPVAVETPIDAPAPESVDVTAL